MIRSGGENIKRRVPTNATQANTASDYPDQKQLKAQGISFLVNGQDVQDSVNAARARPRPCRALPGKHVGTEAAVLQGGGAVDHSISDDLKRWPSSPRMARDGRAEGEPRIPTAKTRGRRAAVVETLSSTSPFPFIVMQVGESNHFRSQIMLRLTGPQYDSAAACLPPPFKRS